MKSKIYSIETITRTISRHLERKKVTPSSWYQVGCHLDKNNTMSLTLYLVLGVFMVSGSAATMSYAATQTLPSCTDPTGHNLPCLMIISTLPPPVNALQCQDTSGQILACSYAKQNLTNGEQIVVITVYVPAGFVFTGLTVIKVVVHTTTSTTGGGTGGSKTSPHKLLVGIGIAKDPIVRGNTQTISVTVSDSKTPSKKIPGAIARMDVTVRIIGFRGGGA